MQAFPRRRPALRRQQSKRLLLGAGSGYNALARDPDYAATFLNEFQDRLFFGTDICAPDTRTPLAGFLRQLHDDGKIGETVFRKVARENAVRELGLE